MKTNDLLEGLSDSAHSMEQEHYLQTVRARAYHLAKESISLYHLLKSVGENEDPAKLTAMAQSLNDAQNLLASVKNEIEFEGIPSIQETVSAGVTGAASIGAVAKPIGSKKKMPLIRR